MSQREESWSQSFDHPRPIRLQLITQTVVQTILAALPELDRLRLNAIATPVRRARNIFAVALRQFRVTLLQRGATFNHFALVRSPRADLAPERTRLKIFFRFVFRNLLDKSFDAHLPLLRQPVGNQARARILGEVRRFAAFVIGVENKTAVVETFQQDDPRRRLSILRRRRQRHRVSFRNAGGSCFVVPLRELLYGVAVNVRLVQGGKHFHHRIRDALKLQRLLSSSSTCPRSAGPRRTSDCHKCPLDSSQRRFPIRPLPNRELQCRCRRDPPRRGFPKSGLSSLLPSNVCLLSGFESNSEDN